ncbi:HAD family hydrolase [uncultured Sphingomonas sp.]|uniref:HAD family hydrolase n=1 Tax=uncultured Sphingomonas sp. TaxID=158754 RepID=UPI0035CB1B13
MTAEDVLSGKPDPASFLLAAGRLNCAPEKCLVFEDAPAGICAGEAAGCDVVVVTATHRQEAPAGHTANRDYRQVSIHVSSRGAPSVREE